MNKIVMALLGMFFAALILFIGGKEENTYKNLKELKVDQLMPPNERIYYYMEKASQEYEVPLKYILRCAKLESNYSGIAHVNFRPYEDRLVSSANAYSVLQVRVIAAKEVWPEHLFEKKEYSLFKPFLEKHILTFDDEQKYKFKNGISPTTKLSNLTNDEFAYLLRYDLKFNVESGVRYMRFLRNQGYSWRQVYSVYNQGWAGAHSINSYALYIAG